MALWKFYFDTIGWILLAFITFSVYVVGWKRTDGKWRNTTRFPIVLALGLAPVAIAMVIVSLI